MTFRIIPLSPDGPEGNGLPPEDLSELPQAKVVEGVVPAHGYVGYTDPTGRYAAGVAEYEAGTIELDSWPMDEFCAVIAGSVEISDARGHTQKFGPGDAFVIPKGFSGTWRMPEKFKKYWTSFSPE